MGIPKELSVWWKNQLYMVCLPCRTFLGEKTAKDLYRESRYKGKEVRSAQQNKRTWNGNGQKLSEKNVSVCRGKRFLFLQYKRFWTPWWNEIAYSKEVKVCHTPGRTTNATWSINIAVFLLGNLLNFPQDTLMLGTVGASLYAADRGGGSYQPSLKAAFHWIEHLITNIWY